MPRLVLLRLSGGILTLFLASVLIFATTEVLPGDAADIALGRQATPQRVAKLREELGLDRPAAERYADWLKGVVKLDFGRSLVEGIGIESGIRERGRGVEVAGLIAPRLEKTGILVLVTVAALVPLSLLLGIASGLTRGSLFDSSTQAVQVVFGALPEFVVGALLIVLFGFLWPVLPPVSLEVSATTLALPVATLTLVAVAYTARMIRAGVIEAAQSDYVVMARLRGLRARRIIRAHILPNSLGPTLQAFALVIGWLAGGVVIVEYLFGYPGMGEGLVRAISSRDFPVIAAYTMIIAGVYIVANLLADLFAMAFNPRLRG